MIACPRCGGETTEADLTYSGCAECRAEVDVEDSQDDVRAPDVLGEVEGWRMWLVAGPPRLPRLFSPYTYSRRLPLAGVWPTGAYLYAHCRKGHEAPAEGCTCGIYALQSHGELVRSGYVNRQGGNVVGRVGLAGLIVPGDRGWRAERARVLELYVPFDLWRLVRPLSRAYQVPVTLANLAEVDGHRA